MAFYFRFLKILALTLSIGCLAQNVVHSQATIKQEKKLYLYGGDLYRYKALEDVFIQNDQAYPYFEKANKRLKTAKALGITAVSSLALGVVMIAVNEPCSGFLCISTQEAIAGISIGLILPITGTIGIIFQVKGKKHQRKSFEIYNKASDSSLREPQEGYLKLGLAKNGLVLTLYF